MDIYKHLTPRLIRAHSRQLTLLIALALCFGCRSNEGVEEELGGVALDQGPQGASPAGGQPVAGTSAGGAPVGGALEGGTPEGGTPEGGTPEGGTPIAGAPVGGVATGGAPEGGAPTGGVPVDPEVIWGDLRSQIDASNVAELVVMFGDSSGARFVHEKGARRDQNFPIASASKLVTSILILKLVEEGALSLDDHPQQHLGELGWTSDPEDPRSRVTLAQLLSFTSGFSGGTGLGGSEGIECVDSGETAEGERSLEACVMSIYEGHFSYEPGEAFYYGPAHMHVAAAMAAQATGQSWGELFRSRLYEPLGMTGITGYRLPSTENPRASGGLVMTGENYAKLLTALVAGELLSPESVTELTRDHTPVGTRFESVPQLARATGEWHYGLGCWRECREAPYSEACDEPLVISSPGAFGFYPWFDQARGYWGLISTQIRIRGSSVTVPLGQAWYARAIEALDQP